MPNKNPDIHRQQAREYYHRHRERLLEQKRNVSPEKKKIEADRKRANYLKHKDKIAARDLLPSRRLSTARSLAKKRGLTWTLTLQQYSEIICKDCYYCEGYFGKTRKGSGCDRINNDLGYSVDNVLSCCGFCNRLRSDVMTVDECKALIVLLINMRKNNVSHLQ